MKLLRKRDAAEVVAEAFRLVAAAARQAVAARGSFALSLAGGSTPKSLYQRLAAEPRACPWEATELFFGDERCVPPEHPDSNYGMVTNTLLVGGAVAPKTVHRMEGELSPEEAARRYETNLTARLDLALLGMGADGHTASLFPGTTALDERTHRCVAVHVPKLETFRLTLTYPVFEHARELVFLVTGADKAATLKEVLEGPVDARRLPSQSLLRAHPNVLLCCDDAAAAALSPSFVAAHAADISHAG
jgi:6-phosphogluconolactonase